MNPGQKLLKEEFQKRREKNQNFSLRSFARWLGTSPAQLSQMMSGKRPISAKSIKKFSQKLELSPFEKKELLAAALQDQTLQNELNAEKKKLLLKEDQFHLIADWYHFAILTLSKLKTVQSDPRWIARELGISFQEANEALQRMVRLGILQLKPKLKQISEPIEVTSEIPSEAIRKYHKQNLNLAAEKLETIPNAFREFQSISLALSPQQMKSFKKLIDQFLEQASQLETPDKSKVIYNLNVQLFPVSKINQPAE